MVLPGVLLEAEKLSRARLHGVRSPLSPSEPNHTHPSNGLQIDNHVTGHKLPVIFCFREGGRLVQDSEAGRGGDGEEAKAGCRFTMSLVSCGPIVPVVVEANVTILNAFALSCVSVWLYMLPKYDMLR